MEDYATLRRSAAGSPATRESGRGRAEPELQRILNQRPAVQRQIELGNALARRPTARPVVQRMSLGEYETEMERLDGDKVSDLLDEGYEAYRAGKDPIEKAA